MGLSKNDKYESHFYFCGNLIVYVKDVSVCVSVSVCVCVYGCVCGRVGGVVRMNTPCSQILNLYWRLFPNSNTIMKITFFPMRI